MSGGFSHLDDKGRASMVDVGAKPVTERRAVAKAQLIMTAQTLSLLLDGQLAKGDALATARVAGILAAKQTGMLIPLCHPLGLDYIAVDFARLTQTSLEIAAEARTSGRTGVEMEAMTAASIAGLTLYDMVKSREKGAVLTDIRLTHKSGGKSGVYEAE